MTKARDLANASTALSAVDATELGYLDGVTSAVQTQINSKAASATAVSTTGGSTITVASGTTVPLTIQNNGTGNSFVVSDVASDTTPFVIDAAGNVAVGAALATKGALYSDDGTAVARVIASSGTTYWGNTSNTPLVVQTNNAERMRIDAAGATTVTYTTTTGGAVRNIYMSTSTPSGGSDGDVWIQYTA